MYKHEDNQLDPRDKNIVTYSPKAKRFITEASTLKAAGITPKWHKGTLGSYFYLWLWSEKLQTSILYKHIKTTRDSEYNPVADVFVPEFSMITTDVQSKAHSLSAGTELHILND